MVSRQHGRWEASFDFLCLCPQGSRGTTSRFCAARGRVSSKCVNDVYTLTSAWTSVAANCICYQVRAGSLQATRSSPKVEPLSRCLCLQCLAGKSGPRDKDTASLLPSALHPLTWHQALDRQQRATTPIRPHTSMTADAYTPFRIYLCSRLSTTMHLFRRQQQALGRQHRVITRIESHGDMVYSLTKKRR